MILKVIAALLIANVFLAAAASGINSGDNQNAGNAKQAHHNLNQLKLKGSAIVHKACISYCREKHEETYKECVSRTCGINKRWIDSSQYEKRWIDTTHYSEGRRSLYTGVEICIRKLCNGLEGGDLQSCAVTCSRRRRRGISQSAAKRWVDPLSYGVHKVQ